MNTLIPPIAIVGMACRFPGGANSPEEFWKLLADEMDAWSAVPQDRWNEDAFFHPDPDKQGMHNHRGGHFLKQDVAAFDGGFFGISPNECAAMDPQQRMVLEVSCETLENAGIPLENVRGTDVGVYVAVFSQDYNLLQHIDVEDLNRYHSVGNGPAITANRVSYTLDLHGPSITIDTGCSGSLVAIHQASAGLRAGECSLALAGGVNLMLSPDQMVAMSHMRIWNEDGKCRSFDSRGTGYGRGEGVGMIALKRLDDAIRDGDPIRAVLHNTGVNQDGKTNGIMMPKADAQRQLIERVYRSAGLNARDTAVVEAHGTGTAVGDTAEMSALAEVFGGNPVNKEVHVGSLKPNIGHLESASGVAGIIKAILMLEKDAIPGTINIDKLKSEMNLTGSGLSIPRKMIDWPEGALRRISVNSFGYGGTNAHAVLDRAPSQPSCIETGTKVGSRGPSIKQVLVLSAQSEKSFSALCGNLQSWLSINKNQRLENLAHTLSLHRSGYTQRKAVVVSSLHELSTVLSSSDLEPVKASPASEVMFVFTGQGAQWHAMGFELLSLQSAFRLSIQKSDNIIRQLGASWSLLEELQKDDRQSLINKAYISQPATTALQIALVDLLVSVDVKPGIVLGHSSGEIAAAYASGHLSHTNAIKVAYYRGQLQISTRGAMLAVGAGEEDLEPMLPRESSTKVVIACANSPSSTTISGDEEAIIHLESRLQVEGIWNRRLKVDRAYHSPHMSAVADQYLQDLSGIDWAVQSSSAHFVSSVTGEPINEFDAHYWVKNLVSKVRFHSAFKYAINLCPNMDVSVVEVGPHNALTGPIRQIISHDLMDRKIFLCPTLMRNTNAIDTFTSLVGRLFECGLSVDIDRINRCLSSDATPRVISSLPPYPWNHQTTYWHESRYSKAHRFRKFPQNDLLGLLVPGGTMNHPVWRNVLDLRTMPWLKDHIVDGQAIYPASAFVCMVIEATKQYSQIKCGSKDPGVVQLKDVQFLAPLVIPEIPQRMSIYLDLEPLTDSNCFKFQVYSTTDQDTSIVYCRGKLDLQPKIEQHRASNDTIIMPRHDQLQQVTEPYEVMRSSGNNYGSNFSLMDNLCMNRSVGFCDVRVPSAEEYIPAWIARNRGLHPTVMDAMTHTSVSIFGQYHGGNSIVVKSIDSIRLNAGMTVMPGSVFNTQTSVQSTWKHGCRTNIFSYQTNDSKDCGNEIVLEQRGVVFQALSLKQSSVNRPEISYRLRWRPDVNFVTATQIVTVNDATQKDDVIQAAKFEALNRASAVYIERCLRRLSEDCVPPIQYHRWLLDWMRRFSRYESFEQLSGGIDTDEILEKTSGLGVEGEILSHMGNSLPEILTAKVDPLSLITEKDLLWRLYADDASTRCYRHLIKFLEHLVFSQPNMDVLEIGAGTGGATEPVFAALSNDGVSPFHSYVFSDISAGFFDRAKARLQKWKQFISFEKLDIEQDASIQGFQERKFDLIVASNVLHVSASINGALSRIKRLLKPGGRLILIETVKNVPFYNTCLGVLPGWWAGAGDDRPDGPFLSIPQWNDAFTRNGFGGVALSAKDFENTAHRCALLVSQPLEDVTAPHPHPTTVQIRVCPGLPQNLARKVTDKLVPKSRLALSLTSFSDPVDQDSEMIIIDDINSPALATQEESCFDHITCMLSKAAKIIWISLRTVDHERQQSYHSLIAGLARVARVENAGLKLATLEIQDDIADEAYAQDRLFGIAKLVDGAFAGLSVEEDYVYKDGIVMIPRLLPDPPSSELIRTSGQRTIFSINKTDSIDDAKNKEHCRSRDDLPSDEVEIEVHAWSVTHRAVCTTAGPVQGRNTQQSAGFSGIVTLCGAKWQGIWAVGDLVCSLGSTPYADRVRVSGDVIAKIPRSISFAHAAAAVFSYTTAWHALVEIAAISSEHEVLVYGAHTPLGQAVTAVAAWCGSSVATTIENDDSDNLSDTAESPDHSDSGFVGSTSSKTSGKFYDVVVNASNDQSSREGLADSVTELGTYIDLAYTHSGLMTLPLIKEGTSYVCPNIDRLRQKDPDRFVAILRKVLSLIDNSELDKPLISLKPSKDVEDLFTERSESFPKVKERKVVIPTAATQGTVGPNGGSQLLQLATNGTYVIAGGLGGLGHEIAKMFAQHGAGTIVLLSRRRISKTEKAAITGEFADLGTSLHVLSCDITSLSSLSESLSHVMQRLPPIRGLVQCAMVLRDRIISQMSLQDFAEGIAPKVTGTLNLLQVLHSQPLDFCLMLSSIIGSVAGSIAEGSYAAGNAFLSHFAHHQRSYGPPMIVISPGAIEDVGVLSQDRATRNILQRQGFPSVSSRHVIDLIRRGLYESLYKHENIEVVSGFDYESLKAVNSPLLEKPMFSHLLRTTAGGSETSVRVGSEQSKKITLREIESYEEAERFVRESLERKIASLVAVNENIDLSKSLADLGADSLVMVELKNWINQTFETSISTTFIDQSSSAQSLVREVTLQCPIIARLDPTKDSFVPNRSASRNEQSESSDNEPKSADVTLPRLPLPDLSSTLQYWLKAVAAGLNNFEYEEAQRMVQDFMAPGSTAHVLHSRLALLADDPAIENWQEKLYYANHHMKPRVPLVPHRCFYGVHHDGIQPHTQAERAAIIAVACNDFRLQAKRGVLEREVVNEQVLDDVQYQYLFNTSREPGIEIDIMAQYPGSEHIVVFRRGNAFKIPLASNSLPRSLQSFQTLFEHIIAAESLSDSSVGVLTNDSRTSWAKNRLLLRSVCAENETWLHDIESAAFIINLDDASPTTPAERGKLFMHAYFNRWSDKPIQFTVTTNGTSAATGEHTMIDGYTMRRVNAHVSKAIAAYTSPTHETPKLDDLSMLSPFAFQTTPTLDQEITRVLHTLHTTTALHSCTTFSTSTISFPFLRRYKLSPKSTLQVAIQLAYRLFYGTNPLAHEAVSLGHFLKGRVDISSILWPEVRDFCSAASLAGAQPSALYPLFIAAITAHASNLARCSRGQGYDRHLLCLQWSAESEEEKPELFKSMIYRESRPRMIMVDSLETGFAEVGSWPSSREGMWIHFEPEGEGVLFSIWGPRDEVGRFEGSVKESLDIVRRIVEAVG